MTIVKIDHTEYGLDEQKAQQIAQMFKPMLDQMEALEVQYNEVLGREIEPETIQMAHDLRLAYVKVRTGTDKIHKKLKAFYLQGGRFVDGWKNAQLMASQGNEDKLKAIEDHFINLEKERVTQLQVKRAEILKDYTEFIPIQLGEMDQGVWDNYLAGAKHTHQQTILAEEKLEEERKLEAEKRAAREKRERAELDRLRKERKKKEAEQQEKDRIQAEEKRIYEEKLEAQRETIRKNEEAEQKRIKAEEEAREAELKKGDKDKMISMLSQMSDLSDLYAFKSKKYQDIQEGLDLELGALIGKIKGE